ncbi:MAG: radical SAM protein [candidate division WOR-3 bacterium]
MSKVQSSESQTQSYVYGPVPSRRFGLSLGLNIIPFKTCTCDCIYCQCGRTTCQTVKRGSFVPIEAVIDQVRAVVKKKRVDFLTFSGPGEPTLNRDIGLIIRRLKQEFTIPVAVLTNSSLLDDPDVRSDILAADVVKATLSVADQQTFVRLNRCHRRLRLGRIIMGLKSFRRKFRGRLWLEVMLVKDINDSPEHLARLRQLVHEIGPDLVHLNTVVRPPAEAWAKPLSYDDLVQVQMLFGPGAEIAQASESQRQRPFTGRAETAIRWFVANRPATEDDLIFSLGIPKTRLRSVLSRLVREGRIKRVRFLGKTFYELS